jgi:hypothetical protein
VIGRAGDGGDPPRQVRQGLLAGIPRTAQRPPLPAAQRDPRPGKAMARPDARPGTREDKGGEGGIRRGEGERDVEVDPGPALRGLFPCLVSERGGGQRGALGARRLESGGDWLRSGRQRGGKESLGRFVKASELVPRAPKGGAPRACRLERGGGWLPSGRQPCGQGAARRRPSLPVMRNGAQGAKGRSGIEAVGRLCAPGA